MLLGSAANRRDEIGIGREHEDRRPARREQLADWRGRQSCVERTRNPKVANVRKVHAAGCWGASGAGRVFVIDRHSAPPFYRAEASRRAQASNRDSRPIGVAPQALRDVLSSPASGRGCRLPITSNTTPAVMTAAAAHSNPVTVSPPSQIPSASAITGFTNV